MSFASWVEKCPQILATVAKSDSTKLGHLQEKATLSLQQSISEIWGGRAARSYRFVENGQKFRLGKIQRLELPRKSKLLNTCMRNCAIVSLLMVELKICDGKLSFFIVIIFSIWDSHFNFLWCRGLGTQGDNIVCRFVTAQGSYIHVLMTYLIIIPNIT